jgi:HD-like signal output (HDOD) protein
MDTSTGAAHDNFLWFGSEPDSDANTLARDSQQLERVLEAGLCPSVEIATRLMRMLEDPEFSTTDVARLIESDPALTARVLTAANSPVFTLRRSCRSISHAVTILGARTIVELTAAAAVTGLYKHRGTEARLRDHAVSTAAVARELAELLRRPSRDLFLAGLLHDLGKLVLLQGAGEERYGTGGQRYDELLERRLSVSGGTYLLEQAALGFDHAALGCAALSAWGIPDPIPDLVGWHHSIELARRDGGTQQATVCVLRLADSLCHAFEGPRLQDQASQLMLREPAAVAELGLDVDELGLLIPQLQHVHAGAASMLD